MAKQVTSITFPQAPDGGGYWNRFTMQDAPEGASGPTYNEPFDISFSIVEGNRVAEVSNLTFQVGNVVYTTGGTKTVTVTGAAYLMAKIDVTDFSVADVVLDANGDLTSDTSDGQYYYKALYKLKSTDGVVSVELDLRGSQLPLLA